MCFFSLFQVRGKVYELLVNCIPPEVLLKVSNKNPILIFVSFYLSFLHIIYTFTEASLRIAEETGLGAEAWSLPLGRILCKIICIHPSLSQHLCSHSRLSSLRRWCNWLLVTGTSDEVRSESHISHRRYVNCSFQMGYVKRKSAYYGCLTLAAFVAKFMSIYKNFLISTFG